VAAFVKERGVVLVLAIPLQVPVMVYIVILQGRLRNMMQLRQVVNKPEEYLFPSRWGPPYVVVE
jgi:hypothetical protein